MEFLKPLLRYWSLTFAVFVFYAFAIIVAGLDVMADAREAAKKKRAQQKPASGLDPNPLTGTTVAATIGFGPGQQLDPKRAWVAGLAAEIVRTLDPTPPVRVVVIEDSKGHPLIHFSNGTRLESYRVDREMVEAAMKGDPAKVNAVAEMLSRHVTADFLGREDLRPRRTTELAREAAPKPAAPKAAAATTAPAAAPAARPAAPTAPAAAVPAADPESMSREERLAAARVKAEAIRQRAQGGTAAPTQPAAPADSAQPAAPAAPAAEAPAASEPAAPPAPVAPAAPAPAAPAPAAGSMTREERLAAARAKVEEMRKRQGS